MEDLSTVKTKQKEDNKVTLVNDDKKEDGKDIYNMTLPEQWKTFPDDLKKFQQGQMSYSEMRLRYG